MELFPPPATLPPGLAARTHLTASPHHIASPPRPDSSPYRLPLPGLLTLPPGLAAPDCAGRPQGLALGPPRGAPSVHRSDVSSQKLFWIAGTPYRVTADATLASRIGRPSPPGAPARGRDARSFRSRRDPDTRYRSRSRIRDPPVDTVPRAYGFPTPQMFENRFVWI